VPAPVQRLVSAITILVLVCAPAVLGACAAQCAQGGAHAATMAGGLPDAAETAVPRRGPSHHPAPASATHQTAHSGPVVAAHYHGTAESPCGPPAQQRDGAGARVQGCCSDAASAIAIPARLADRETTMLFTTTVDPFALSLPRTPVLRPHRDALVPAPAHRRRLVLRI
jgi:hypothetical protein